MILCILYEIYICVYTTRCPGNDLGHLVTFKKGGLFCYIVRENQVFIT
jgi:hypothetical protein